MPLLTAARKARNLRRNPACTLTAATEHMHIVNRGGGAPRPRHRRAHPVGAAYVDKSGWPAAVEDGAFTAPYGAPTAGPPPYHVYEIVGRVGYAFGLDDEFGPRTTRWES